MKNKIFLLVILLVSVFGCGEEEFIVSRDYPIIIINQPTSIDETGVVISATILKKGKMQIEEMGFNWRDEKGKTFRDKVDAAPDSVERIELKIALDLEKGIKYTYQAYLKVEGILILSNEESFVSQGSRSSEKPKIIPPEIKDFYPKSGDSGDLITIVGNNIVENQHIIKVFFGNDEAEVVLRRRDTVTVLVPNGLSTSGNVNLLLTKGSVDLLAGDFFLEAHRIENYYPRSGRIGETEIEILGTGFDRPIDEIKVKLGEEELEIVDATFSKLIIKLPYDMNSSSGKLEVHIGNIKRLTSGSFYASSRWRNVGPYDGCPKLLGEKIGDFIFGGENANCSEEEESRVFGLGYRNAVTLFPGKARQSGVSFKFGQNIYYGTGGNNLSDFWEYDTRWNKHTWSQLSDFPDNTGRSESVYYSFNGKGYLIGGKGDKTSNGAEVWEFDPNSKSWRLLGTTSISSEVNRFNQLFFERNNEAFLISDNALYKFDITSSNFFVKVADIPLTDRIRASDFVFAFNNFDLLFFSNGIDDLGLEEQQMMWSYDLVTYKLSRIENSKGGNVRNYKTSFVHSDQRGSIVGMLLFMGSSASNVNNDYWWFDKN